MKIFLSWLVSFTGTLIYTLLRYFFDFTLHFKKMLHIFRQDRFSPFHFHEKSSTEKITKLFQTLSFIWCWELIFDQWETTVLVTWLILRFVIGFNRNQNRENCWHQWHQTSWAGARHNKIIWKVQILSLTPLPLNEDVFSCTKWLFAATKFNNTKYVMLAIIWRTWRIWKTLGILARWDRGQRNSKADLSPTRVSIWRPKARSLRTNWSRWYLNKM